jgi:hypothetical protein
MGFATLKEELIKTFAGASILIRSTKETASTYCTLWVGVTKLLVWQKGQSEHTKLTLDGNWKGYWQH